MSKKKAIFTALFLVLIFALTIYYVFNGQDLKQILDYMQDANMFYWSGGVVCVIVTILFESVIFFYLMRTAKQKVQMSHCFLYSFIGFFFSCITPSASGGQPAQVLYMKKDGLPISVSSLMLLIITITYKMVLIFIGACVLLFAGPELRDIVDPIQGWCILGMFLNVCAVTAMLVLIFHPTLAEKFVNGIARLMTKMKLVKRREQFLEKVDTSMKQYQGIAAYFKTHKLVIWNVFVITFFQRVTLFAVTYLVWRSFGFAQGGFIKVITLQALISLAVEMLPLPGGMGISESLYLKVFTPLMGALCLPSMIVSRGISYYTQLIISAIMTVIAHLVLGREKLKGEVIEK